MALLFDLGELKDRLNLKTDNNDPMLESMAVGVCAQVERYCDRRFAPQDGVTKTVRTQGLYYVRVPDVRLVTRVAVDGIDATNYQLTGYGLVNDDDPATHILLPSVGHMLTITGNFGFAQVPEDIKHAALILAARSYRERDAGWSDSVQFADGGSANYFRQLPAVVEAILNSYRVPGL